MKLLRIVLACGALIATLALAVPATAGTTLAYHATFVEVGPTGCMPGTSCGSATISGLGHVGFQNIAFDACGPNCHLRTIAFEEGTLLIRESVVGQISPGNSSSAGANAPGFLEISQTIVGGTGTFAGATGSGSGRVNLAAEAIITASGTITLP